jgi:FecR protein
MRWLEPREDVVEEILSEALDAARNRTGDEIARRRIWTRIAIPGIPFRGRPWLARVALLGTLVAATVAAVVVWPRSTGHEHSIVAVAPSARGPLASSEPRELALAPLPTIEGPLVVRTGNRQTLRGRLVGGSVQVDLEPNTVLSVDRKQRAVIERGRVRLAVPKQPAGKHFAIRAGRYVISVIGTKFRVRVAGDNVAVDVDEGVVEVLRGHHKERILAGDLWNSPPEQHRATSRRGADLALVDSAARHPMLRPTRPPAMPSSGPFPEVKAALAEGHPQHALDILEVAARGDGPEAEVAAYEAGWVLRDRLSRPQLALSAWDRYRKRFPRGLLRAETDLSVIETMLMLRDGRAALAEATAFLDRHPGSERRGEIAQLVTQLRKEPTETPSPGQAEAGAAGAR